LALALFANTGLDYKHSLTTKITCVKSLKILGQWAFIFKATTFYGHNFLMLCNKLERFSLASLTSQLYVKEKTQEPTLDWSILKVLHTGQL
jgi:hypothetical protein